MINRIVRMTLNPEHVEPFTNMFNERKSRIRNFPGCRHLELWRDSAQPNAFFTYSIWESEDALNHYRFSDFFKDTWSITRNFFAAKAEAWTVEKLEEIEGNSASK